MKIKLGTYAAIGIGIGTAAGVAGNNIPAGVVLAVGLGFYWACCFNLIRKEDK